MMGDAKKQMRHGYFHWPKLHASMQTAVFMKHWELYNDSAYLNMSAVTKHDVISICNRETKVVFGKSSAPLQGNTEQEHILSSNLSMQHHATHVELEGNYSEALCSSIVLPKSHASTGHMTNP